MLSLESETEAVLNSFAWRSIDGTLDPFAPVKLLVQLRKHQSQRESRSYSNSGHHTVMYKGSSISGFGRLRVQVARIDGRTVRDGVDETKCSSSLRWGTGQGVADPCECRGVS